MDTYIRLLHGKEVFISNVSFMDSLSHFFLGYFSYSLALLLVSPVTRKGWKFALSHPPWYSKKVLFLAAILFVLQDVLIDPVSLRGSKWFLGQIYYYPEKGIYFGVTLSNFLGWLLVGLAIIYCFQKLDHKMGWSKEFAGNALMAPVLYFLNMIFISVSNILYRWVLYRNKKSFYFQHTYLSNHTESPPRILYKQLTVNSDSYLEIQIFCFVNLLSG